MVKINKINEIKNNLSPILIYVAILLILAILAGGSVALLEQGQSVGLLFFGALAGSILAYLLLNKPLFGIVIIIASSFPLLWLSHNSQEQVYFLGLPVRLSLLLRDGVLFMVVIGWLYQLLSQRLSVRSSKLTILVTIFMGWAFIRGISSSGGITIGVFGIRLAIQYLVMYFMVSSSIKTERSVRLVLWALIFSSVIPTIYTILQVDNVIGSLATSQVEQFGRVYSSRISFLGSLLPQQNNTANTFAGYLGAVLISMLAWFWFEDKLWQKKKTVALMSVYSLMVLLLLLLSFSRRVWVGLLLVFIIFWALRRASPSALLLPTLLIMTLYLFLPEQVFEWIVRRFSTVAIATNQNVSSVRLAEWTYLWNGIFQSIWSVLFGHGFGLIGTIPKTLGIESKNWVNGHNYYLATMYQMGLTGLIVFLMIIFEGIRNALRGFKSALHPAIRQGSMAAFGIIALLMVSALAGNTFEAYPLNVLFWTFLGLTEAIEKMNDTQITCAKKSVRGHV